MPRRAAATTWTAIGALTAIVVAFFVLRVAVDQSFLIEGTRPEPGDFEERYVDNPVLAYLHIVPGLVYLLIAPWQLSRRFREAHWALHPQLGRVAFAAGIICGCFALAFGLPLSFGGVWQAGATAVFGAYFLVALATAYRAIRLRDVARHRRWMIRAFAVGLGVGTIRIWVGVLTAADAISFRASFAVAFWLAFTMHAAAAELWLRWRPDPVGGLPAIESRAGDRG